MQTLYLAAPKAFGRDEFFNLKSPHNRDNCFYPNWLLKERLAQKGIAIHTYDLRPAEDQDSPLLFYDTPRNLEHYLEHYRAAKKFLYIYESPIKNQRNHDRSLHRHFEKIFTWDKDTIDQKKYFRVSYSQKIPRPLAIDRQAKHKLCCGIFGHKLQSAPRELYSERMRAIRWFERHAPQDFDLFGQGWGQHYFHDRLFQLNRIPWLTKLAKPNVPSWKGPSKEKRQTYRQYRFAICYENAAYQNYITEKIFDCFFGGAIPIYLGEPNVVEDIPKETFIDKRDFPSYEALYEFIKKMPHGQYETYLDAIERFVNGKAIEPFSAEWFADTISREIAASLSL